MKDKELHKTFLILTVFRTKATGLYPFKVFLNSEYNRTLLLETVQGKFFRESKVKKSF